MDSSLPNSTSKFDAFLDGLHRPEAEEPASIPQKPVEALPEEKPSNPHLAYLDSLTEEDAPSLPREAINEEDAPSWNPIRKLGERGLELTGNLVTLGGKALERTQTVGDFTRFTAGKLVGEEYTDAPRGLDVGKSVREAGQGIADTSLGYIPQMSFDQVRASKTPGELVSNLGAYVVENGPASLADMAAILTVPGAYYASLTEEYAQQHAKNDGRTQPTSEDYPYGLGTAAVSALLEKFGADAAILKDIPIETLKDLGRGILRGFFREGSTEFLQSGAEDIGTTMGTKTGVDLDRAFWAGVAGAAVGGPVGGAVSGTVGTGKLLFSDPGVGIRAEQDKRLADLQDELEQEPPTIEQPAEPEQPVMDQPVDVAEQPTAVEPEPAVEQDPQVPDILKTPPPVTPLDPEYVEDTDPYSEAVRNEQQAHQTAMKLAMNAEPDIDTALGDIELKNEPAGAVHASARELALTSSIEARYGATAMPDTAHIKAARKNMDTRFALADLFDTYLVPPQDSLARRPHKALQTRLTKIRDSFIKGNVGDAMHALANLAYAPGVSEHYQDAFRKTLEDAATIIGGTALTVDANDAVRGVAQIVGFFGRETGKDAANASLLIKAKELADSFLKTYVPTARLNIVYDKALPLADNSTHVGYMSKADFKTDNGIEPVYTIVLRPDMIKMISKQVGISEDAIIGEVMYHELGHLLSYHEFKRASKEIQQAVMNDYRRWLRDRRWTESEKDFLLSWRSPVSATFLSGGQLEDGSGVGYYRQRPGYWYSFNEFIAETSVRSIYKNGPIQEDVARPFYRRVWDAMQNLYNEMVGKYPQLGKVYPGVDAWMESLKYRNQRMRLESGDAKGMADLLGVSAMAMGGTEVVDALAENVIREAAMTGPPRNQLKDLFSHLPKFKDFAHQILTIPQLEREFKDVPGMKRTVEGIRRWWATKGQWTARGVDTLAAARDLKIERNKQELKAFENFQHTVTLKSNALGRKLTTAELDAIATQTGLSANGFTLWQRMQGDFTAALNKTFDLLERDARRELANDPVALGLRLQKLQQQKREMLDQNYAPLMRFGKYYTKVVAAQPVTVDGVSYSTGQIVYFGLKESNRDGDKEFKWAQDTFSGPEFKVTPGLLEEQDMGLVGLPDFIVQKLLEIHQSEMTALGATAQEIARAKERLTTAFSELKLDMAPASSFRKKLQRRKGTPGFSSDALRAYASFMQSFSNFIARAEHSHEILEGLKEMKNHSRNGLPRAQKIRIDRLRQYMEKHYDYLMTPQNEWANLRSLATLWYLGFVARSAFVNITQVPLATQPWLAARYGYGKSITYLLNAMKDIRSAWTAGRTGSIEPDLARALDQGYKDEFLNESLASELGGYAEGSNLQRLLPGWVPGAKNKVLNQRIRQGQQMAMALFQFAERINRLISFTAAFRAHRDMMLNGRDFNALSQQEQEAIWRASFEIGRESVETTQGEYARWARPNIMKGKKSILFLFKSYLQHMMYMALKDKGRKYFWINSAIIGGVLGMPMAQNALDIVEFLMNALDDEDKKKDPERYLREILEELVGEIHGAPDLILRGTGHYGFGIPGLSAFDLHASLSLGTIAPGTESLNRTASYTDPYATMGRMAESIAGPVGALFYNTVRAIQSTEANQWKRWERAMPVALKGLSKAARVSLEGEEIRTDGSTLIEFDPENINHVIEVGGITLGFTPRRQTMQQEVDWAMKQAVNYYTSRRTVLLGQYFAAQETKDREALTDVLAAIKRFNNTTPKNVPKISSQDLFRSYKNRKTSRMLEERGYPTQKSYSGVTKEIRESYPDFTWEEPSR